MKPKTPVWTVSVPQELDNSLEMGIKQGRFVSKSDVIRDAVRQQLTEKEKTEALEELVTFFKDELEKNNQEIESLRQRIEKIESERHGKKSSFSGRSE